MAEHRFRDPDGNEWVTLTDPSPETIAGYPAGTVEIPMVPVVPVPDELPPLSGRQIRIALRSIGITSEMVEANIVAAISDPLELDLALIEWRNAGLYEFDHPMIAEMAAAFELPAEQVEALWRWSVDL